MENYVRLHYLYWNKHQKNMNIYSYPNITEDEVKLLWNDSILIFDTSSLCALYDLTQYYRDIMIGIFKDLKDRLWIPYHVYAEFERNRIKAITNPIKEKYSLPRFIQEDKFIHSLQEQIKIWEENTYLHPYIDEDKLESIKSDTENANKYIRSLKDNIKEQYEKRKNEIKGIAKNDQLWDFVKQISKGNPHSYKEIQELIKEGEFRYRNQLPPGFMDSISHEECLPKKGIDKYGDFIIWKDIIEYAKKNNKNVFFLTDDKKKDWRYYEGPHKGKPLKELLVEFNEITKKNILI